MKKTNIFKIILGLIPACFLSSISAVYNINNKAQNINTARKPTDEEIEDLETLKIDATLIGAVKGTFTVKCIGNYCVLVKVSNNFLATGDFNFNGGKFWYRGTEYIIYAIAPHAFEISWCGWYFKNCNLTIPSTIRSIGDYAFYQNFSIPGWPSNREIISVKFEGEIENIGIEAFGKCYDINQMDLTALDHVIKLNCKPFDKGGCFYHTPINKILVKDQNMRDQYTSDKYWSSVAEYFEVKDEKSLTISSKYIGANEKSTFTFSYADAKHIKITGVSKNFEATGDFDFNGGKFKYNGIEYTIIEIGSDVFKISWFGSYFKNCNLTIPSTIKIIGNHAFYGNSRNWSLSDKEVISIHFNEGIEYIGSLAFYNCNDLENSRLVLPNSLKHIGNSAFQDVSPLKELDLTALDHVLDLDLSPLDREGFLFRVNIETIWVKDEAMREKYSIDQYWSSLKDMIKVKY
ncbi:MAG: leucine-rich repeat protein [Malacoplasma sp.]|nr:leucine-rich repeat protein [Malacoplasma sp.]